ncbi:hypothetical protein ACFWFI_11400 [Streptomyces sp. NPDC060209]|uniref:hypothetical protein n=1 Tax=Streptomyces sp. NPDC060209 TaxID=3347073 RepID=UPI003662B647
MPHGTYGDGPVDQSLRPLGPAELLSVRVAEADSRSRTGLGLAGIRGTQHTRPAEDGAR